MNLEPRPAGGSPASEPAARPLIPLTAALALGVASTAWGLRLSGPLQILSFAVLGAVLILTWIRRKNARLAPLAWFWLLGLVLSQQALEPPLPPQHVVHLPQEREIILRGRLCQPPRLLEGRVRLLVEAGAWRSPEGWRPAVGKVLVNASSQTARPLEGGEVIVRTALREFRDAHNPGAFQRSRYWASQEVFREARLKKPSDLCVLASAEPPSLRERLREGLRRRLASLDEITRSLYLALILGDQGEIGQDLRRAFSRTGTSHLLAISGLHLGMLAGLSFLAVFWLLRRFPRVLLRVNAIKVASLMAAGPMAVYAWIAGGSPATQRAEIMIIAYLLLVLAGRPREGPSALALAALIILVLSPLLLFSLSFQLSFVSVAALLYFWPRWVTRPDPEVRASGRGQQWGQWALFWSKGAFLTSLVATLATAPLVAASFHQVSVVGVLVNLAAIPLVSGLAVPAGLLALAAESLSFTPLAQGFLYLGQIPLKVAYAVISRVAALPGSAVILPTPGWLQIALYYGLALLLFPPRRTLKTWAAAALAGAILAASVAAPGIFRSQAGELMVLDSSAGLSGVLVSPDDRRLVLSGGWPTWPGGEAGSVGPLPGYLHWRQFRHLDLVLALGLTSRSAPELLRVAQEFTASEAWFAGGDRGEEVIALRNFLGDTGKPAKSLRPGEAPAALGALKLAYYALEEGRGVVLVVSLADRRLAIFPPARLESSPVDRIAAQGQVAALVVPRRPPLEWLSVLKPECVVIYGFADKVPANPQTTAQFFYTREGAVTLKLAAAGLTVSQWRP